MDVIRFPMWHAGSKRMLLEVLRDVPTDVEWVLKWFDGSWREGHPTIPIDKACSLSMTHSDLQALALRLTDLNWLELVGIHSGIEFKMEAIDSTTWAVTYPSAVASDIEGWFSAFIVVPEGIGTLPTTSTKS